MKKLLVLFTAICLVLCLAACGEGSGTAVNTDPAETSSVAETTPAVTESTASFVVKVTDKDGNALKGVMLQICKDTCIPMMTDDNGVASFNIEVTDEHKLSVLSCPEGYVYNGEAEVYLEDGMTEFTVELDAQ